MGKYHPLYQFLSRAIQRTLTLTFEELERILGFLLPATARKRQQWWGNEDTSNTRHTQRRAWLDAGFHVNVDMTNQTATFSRV